MTKYRIGVIGLVHDHIWGVLNSFAEDSRAEIVAAADPNPPLLEKVSALFRVERTYSDYKQMLQAEKLDVALVYTDNTSGADAVEAAARAGVHCVVEKPMAATLEQADRMLIAAKENNIKLMVNWPTAWSKIYQHALTLARSGAIGELFKVRYRSGHQGPKEIGCDRYFYEWLYDKSRNGAGALMDYCCYGADFAAYLLGRPNAVTGIAGRFVKDYITVEDNAILLAKYDHGIAICEASWTTYGFGYELMINGTTGTIKADPDELVLATKDDPVGTVVDVPDLPVGQRTPAESFLNCLEKDLPVEGLCSPEVSRLAQEILEAGLIAVEAGTTVPLPVISRR